MTIPPDAAVSPTLDQCQAAVTDVLGEIPPAQRQFRFFMVTRIFMSESSESCLPPSWFLDKHFDYRGDAPANDSLVISMSPRSNAHNREDGRS